jgi:hypothetical protein
MVGGLLIGVAVGAILTLGVRSSARRRVRDVAT